MLIKTKVPNVFCVPIFVHTLCAINDVTEGSTQEAHMCFLEKQTKWCKFLVKLALKKTMCASQVLPTMLVRRQHTGSTHHCLLSQNRHMCASWVLPSVTSLMDRSVYLLIFPEQCFYFFPTIHCNISQVQRTRNKQVNPVITGSHYLDFQK